VSMRCLLECVVEVGLVRRGNAQRGQRQRHVQVCECMCVWVICLLMCGGSGIGQGATHKTHKGGSGSSSRKNNSRIATQLQAQGELRACVSIYPFAGLRWRWWQSQGKQRPSASRVLIP